MERVGIVTNFRKDKEGRLLKTLTRWLEERGVEVVVPQYQGEHLGAPGAGAAGKVDMIISLGGDGTLLSTARRFVGTGVPILGVNLGHLGFLTDLEVPDLFSGMEKILRGEYEVEERMMLAAEVRRGSERVAGFYALNDAVITKGPLSRIISLETYVGQDHIATFRSDGIIVATPTGSTAYSLSAGGPIVSPDLEVLILTPICPHTLYARPLILAHHHVVRIFLRSDQPEVMLTIDGQVGFHLQEDDEIIVRKADMKARLVKVRQRTFFEVLRHKLQESEW